MGGRCRVGVTDGVSGGGGVVVRVSFVVAAAVGIVVWSMWGVVVVLALYWVKCRAL